MIVLESAISHVRRNRDFGVVEARVTLLAKTHRGHPPHRVSILTHAFPKGNDTLRKRLIDDAIRTATFRTLRQAERFAPLAA
jgi:hypothetical protein